MLYPHQRIQNILLPWSVQSLNDLGMWQYAEEIEIPPLHSKNRPARVQRPLQLRCLLQLTTSSNHYTHATTPTIETNYTYTTVKLDFLLKPILYHLLSVRKKAPKALYLPPPSCEGLPHQTCPPQPFVRRGALRGAQTSTAHFNGRGHIQSIRIWKKKCGWCFQFWDVAFKILHISTFYTRLSILYKYIVYLSTLIIYHVQQTWNSLASPGPGLFGTWVICWVGVPRLNVEKGCEPVICSHPAALTCYVIDCFKTNPGLVD